MPADSATLSVASPLSIPLDAKHADRLERARALAPRQVVDGQFVLTGSKDEIYYIRIQPEPTLCYCKDSIIHGGYCKHVLAALLAVGDSRVTSSGPRPRTGLGTQRPPADSLIDATARLAAGDTSQALAGWILTHPRASWEHYQVLATHSRRDEIQSMLTRVPTAMQDSRIRETLARHAVHPTVLNRLLPHTEGIEFRHLFRRLIALDQALPALNLLTDPAVVEKARFLEPEDLLGLFTYRDPAVKERAMELLVAFPAPTQATAEAPAAVRPPASRRRRR